jgi:hypothetical protein
MNKTDKEFELKLKLLDDQSNLTREEYYDLCLETTDEINHDLLRQMYPVSILEFNNGNWIYKDSKLE